MKNEIQTAWSKAVNNKDNWSFKDPVYGNKIKGKLNINHYITYNIIRGLPIARGFTNIDNYYFKSYTYKLERFRKSFSQGGIFDLFDKQFGDDCVFPFNGRIDLLDFKEKADEALRLYSNS